VRGVRGVRAQIFRKERLSKGLLFGGRRRRRCRQSFARNFSFSPSSPYFPLLAKCKSFVVVVSSSSSLTLPKFAPFFTPSTNLIQRISSPSPCRSLNQINFL